MPSPDQYKRNALQCLTQAADVSDPLTQAVLRSMAQAWLRLAEQADKNGATNLVYETPPSDKPDPKLM
jgi:hypothetical protein